MADTETTPTPMRKPSWLRARIPIGDNYKKIKNLILKSVFLKYYRDY